MMRERNVAEQEERDRAFMAERLATWDDDREAERGRESFYIDRFVVFFLPRPFSSLNFPLPPQCPLASSTQASSRSRSRS